MADSDSRAGARYTTSEILAYTSRIHAPHDAGLTRAFDSAGAEGIPAIMVGPSEGKLLELLVRLAGVHKAVEVGTLAGYSALRIARALPAGGRLYTIESDARHAGVARDNLAAAGVADVVEVREGDAVAVLAELSSLAPFDLVFLDADKAGYEAYGQWAAEHLRAGGLLVADNAYLFGRLLDESDEATRMRAFHEQTAQRFDSVCIPTPDGLVVGIRR